MKKYYLIMLIAFFSMLNNSLRAQEVCDAQNKCYYEFVLSNWNGSTFKIVQNGQTVATGGDYVYSNPLYLNLPLCKNIPFQVYWVKADNYNSYNVGLTIHNKFGQTLYSGQGVGTNGQLIYSGMVDCDKISCDIQPTPPSAIDWTKNSATLNWSAPGTSVWDLYVVPEGSPAPNASTKPTYSNITEKPFKVTELTPFTNYTAYVRIACASPTSVWSAPSNFTTRLCDEADKCSYTFKISDSNYGAKNYSNFQVWQNGKIEQYIGWDYTSMTTTVPLCKDLPFELFWEKGQAEYGGAQTTIIDVINRFGQTVYRKAAGTGTVGTTLYTGISNCDKVVCDIAPTSLSASNITKTGATLGWGTPIQAAVDIYIAPAGSAAPTAETKPTYSGITGNTFPVNDLSVMTPYTFYVRVACSTPSDVWSAPFTFNTLSCDTADKCNYTFVMTDTGKDGWNSGRIKVRQNGILVGTIGSSITNGGPTNATVSLCNNIPFDLYWDTPGTKPKEIGLQVINPFGDPIYSLTPGSVTVPDATNPVILFASTGNCTPPTCTRPSSLVVSNVKTSEATINWTENGTATKWEYLAIPAGTVAPLNGSSVDMNHITDIKPYTLTGLQPSTKYDFYVRSICSATDSSTWTLTGKKTFITISANDECSSAIEVPVNATAAIETAIKGNTLGATTSSPNTNPLCNGYADDDVWFSFVATSDKHIITLQNIQGDTTDLNHALYSGNECGNLTQLYCSDPNLSLASNLTPGNTYKIRVYTNNQSVNANFDIAVTTPPVISNDDCSSGIAVPVNDKTISGQTVKGSVTRATASAENSICSGTADDDVWYSFIAKGTKQKITLSNISGTTEDLYYAVYSGDCGSLNKLYCGKALSSIADTYDNYVIGQTYFVRVWSYAATEQAIDFTLSIDKMSPPVQASTTQYSTQELVTKVLMNNPCVVVNNITWSTGTDFGSVNGIGSFSIPSDSEFPIAKGLVLSTGNAVSIPGPNTTASLSEGSASWPGDAQLESIILKGTGTTMVSHNASKLEFDFISQSDFMSFNFLFASEEYGTYQCNYSDSFAFSLTDKLTNTTTNLAVVPGTSTPVSVVTIRDKKYNMGCSSEHSAYFDHYYGAANGTVTSADENPNEAPTNFNGTTKLMTASSALIPGHEYHIKLVIADRGDALMDSAVFIQSGSFNSGEPTCMEHFKLVAFNDTNSNGIKDNGESDFNYGSFVIQKNNS